jgi:hypothetical protein
MVLFLANTTSKKKAISLVNKEIETLLGMKKDQVGVGNGQVETTSAHLKLSKADLS